jgi:ATP-binding cassette subfamily F protein uup
VAILLDLQNISLQGFERAIIENLNLTISSGDCIGVVGINGAGKSTLLRIIAGVLEPDGGQRRQPQTVRVGYLEQIPELPLGTVREALGHGWQIDAALDRLGMLGSLDTPTDQLSGGQLKRVALARLFAGDYDVLIMDEPTNHLDLGAIQWLEQQIRSFKGAVVLVSHDRFLLDQVTTRMLEIDRGKTYTHGGGYAKLLEAQAEREEQAANAEQVRRNLARTELAWLRRGVKARSTKPQARIDAAERLLNTRPEAAARDGSMEFVVETPRLGTMVIKAHQVSFAYPGGMQMLDQINLELGPGDRIGIVGPNGAGKTTILNVLAQRSAPTSGTVKHGPTVAHAFFDQEGGDFDGEKTVQELVAGPRGVPDAPENLAIMKRFWFTGALTKTKAKDLSGGERRRLQLLLALNQKPNVLFLDEPTNDLDLETIRLVEEFLRLWSGTLVVVSHDRTFLSRTTERLLEVHPDGSLRDVPGGIDAWIARSLGVGVVDTAAERAEVAAPTTASKSKLLREAEKDMTRLEKKRLTLMDKIASTSDYQVQTALGSELEQILVDLAAAEERWLELAE